VATGAKAGCYTRTETGATEPVYILRSLLRGRVKSSRVRKLAFGAIIGIGLFGTQAVTLFATGKATATTILAALAFSMVAGMGAAFQLKTKV